MPLGYSAADDLPSDESGRRPLKATSELDGLARPQARAHKEAEEDGGAAAAGLKHAALILTRLRSPGGGGKRGQCGGLPTVQFKSATCPPRCGMKFPSYLRSRSGRSSSTEETK